MPQKTQKFPHITFLPLTNGGYEIICTHCRGNYFSGRQHDPAALEIMRRAFEKVHAGCQSLDTRPLREAGEAE